MDYSETELNWLDTQIIEQAIDSRRFPGVLFLHGDDCRYFCAKVKAALSLAARTLAAEQELAEVKKTAWEDVDEATASQIVHVKACQVAIRRTFAAEQKQSELEQQVISAQQQAQEAVQGRVEAVERAQRAEEEVKRLYAMERARYAPVPRHLWF